MQKDFPFEKLKVTAIFYEFTQDIEDVQDAEFELIIDFEPFEIDGQEFTMKLEFVGFSNPQLEKNVFLKGCTFNDEDELEPSSIYFQSVHNPIDLKKLKIERKEKLEIFEIELLFDFEFENTDYKNHLLKIQFEKEI